MHFDTFTNHYKSSFEDYLINIIENKSQTDVEEAMTYSLKAGGKRLRPLLLIALVKAFKKNERQAFPIAAALEMIHTYSLIHDDLPAMDDDDLRRGKPANHIAFSEATAILAGDALLTKAFEVIAAADLSDETKISVIRELTFASGHEGMIGGQQADMDGEKAALTLEQLSSIHYRKTGMLIMFAFKAAGSLARIDEETVAKLDKIAEKIGIAYQIRDDILDVSSSEEALGKRVGSDVKKGKSTYPSLLGIYRAKTLLDEHLDEALKLNAAIKSHVNNYDEELLGTFIASIRLK
ncbi:polyprenyl synthetase family protein [Alkalibacterium kapii]|uniref:Farnesyl diphosphate synthase n=1 Tax=Alkalibacterium kapii TaxID=426704 RepID=A0A511B0L2_9LACT|nr:farnesyl diphosphate synthase [Alkalibacterium kapii]GEK91347.1 farnesyl-diphosphate synthase [Alkalibacterium kapii]